MPSRRYLCMLDCGTGFICHYDEKTHTFTPRAFKTRRAAVAPSEWLTSDFTERVLAEAVRHGQPVVLNEFSRGLKTPGRAQT